MKEKLKSNFFSLMYRHDFSIAWLSVIFFSSCELLLFDLSPVQMRRLEYNALLVAILGFLIIVFKLIAIKTRKATIHNMADFLGASWLMFMGLVTSASVPPQFFTGVILLTLAFLIDLRLYVRARSR